VPLARVDVGATFKTTSDIVDAVDAVTVTYATGVFEDSSGRAPLVADRCASCSAGTPLGLPAPCAAVTVPVQVTPTVPTPSPVACGIVIVSDCPLKSDAAHTG
jgi:hypothetical protein